MITSSRTARTGAGGLGLHHVQQKCLEPVEKLLIANTTFSK